MEAAVLAELAAIEKLDMPETHKRARTTRMRRHHDTIRATNRQIEAGRLYTDDETPCRSRAEVGRALEEYWSPVFEARASDADAASRFLPYAVDLGLDPGRRWPRGGLREVVASASDSSPGLDGIGDSFWESDPEVALSVIDDLAELTQDGVALLGTMRCSHTVFIPKASLAPAGEISRATAALQRPLTLINTSEKLVALTVSRELAPAAARAIAGPQCGFVQGRRIEDDIIGLDGCLTAYSIDYTSRVVALLLDFANTFPSLSHSWLFAVLATVGLLRRLMNIVKVMYMDICTRLYFAGVPVCRLRMLSGICQGCPLSGTLFAIALDPLIRWYVSRRIFNRTRIFCYADDIASVAHHLFIVLPYVSRALRSHVLCVFGASRPASS